MKHETDTFSSLMDLTEGQIQQVKLTCSSLWCQLVPGSPGRTGLEGDKGITGIRGTPGPTVSRIWKSSNGLDQWFPTGLASGPTIICYRQAATQESSKFSNILYWGQVRTAGRPVQHPYPTFFLSETSSGSAIPTNREDSVQTVLFGGSTMVEPAASCYQSRRHPWETSSPDNLTHMYSFR